MEYIMMQIKDKVIGLIDSYTAPVLAIGAWIGGWFNNLDLPTVGNLFALVLTIILIIRGIINISKNRIDKKNARLDEQIKKEQLRKLLKENESIN